MIALRDLFIFSKEPSFKSHLKNYGKLVFVICPLTAIIFVLAFNGVENFIYRYLISLTISWIVASFCYGGSYALLSIYIAYRKKRRLGPLKKNNYRGSIIAFPLVIPGLYVGFIAAHKLSILLGDPMSPPDFSDYSAGLLFGTMISITFTLLEVVRDSNEVKKNAELEFRAFENELLKAQVSALTAQMNPHLLFNSLNTIASTITSDPKSAEDMVVQLSELYRGILKSAKGDMHSLENELLLCRSYLDIEQRRFGSRIQYKIDVDGRLDPQKIKIPVLLLQPLVENAVKHGISPQKEGGYVLVEVKSQAGELLLHVIDNGVGIRVDNPSRGTGTGLSNCESRIKLKYGESSKFSFGRNKDETAAVIRLPFHEVAHD